MKDALDHTEVRMERKNDECLHNHIRRSQTRSSYRQCAHDKKPNVRNVGDPQLDVDLLTNGHEVHPMTCSQCHVLFWHGHRCYFHFNHYDAQLPIMPVSEKEYSMCRWC